jgi:hypothetical protein
MSFGQFDERILTAYHADFDDSYPLDTFEFISPGNFGSRLDVGFACNTDTVDHVLSAWQNGVIDRYTLGSVVIPAGAGNGTIPAVDIVAAFGTINQPCLVAAPGNSLYLVLEAAPSTGKLVTVNGWGGLF